MKLELFSNYLFILFYFHSFFIIIIYFYLPIKFDVLIYKLRDIENNTIPTITE